MNLIKLCVVIAAHIIRYTHKDHHTTFGKAAMDERFEKILKERPTLEELCENICIGDNWYQLGIQLDIDHKKLKDIHKLPDSSASKMTKMFELWLDANPYATRRQVIDALRKELIEENTIAHKYEETLKKYCSSSSE